MGSYNPSTNTEGGSEYNSHYASVNIESIDHYNSSIGLIKHLSNCKDTYFKARPFIKSNNSTGSFDYQIEIIAKKSGTYRLSLYGVTRTKEQGNAHTTITFPNGAKKTEQWLSPSGLAEVYQFRDLGLYFLKAGSNIFKINTTVKGITGNIVAHNIREYKGDSNGIGNLFFDKITFSDNSVEDTNSGTLHIELLKQDCKFGGYLDENSNSYLVFDMKDRINIFGGSTLNDNNILFGGYISEPADRNDIQNQNTIGFMDRWDDATTSHVPKSILIGGEPPVDNEDTVSCNDVLHAIQYVLDCLEHPLNYTNLDNYIDTLPKKTNSYIYNTASNGLDDTLSKQSSKYNNNNKSKMEKTLEQIDKKYEKLKKEVDTKYDKLKDTVSILYAKDKAKAQKVLPKGISAKDFKKIEEKLNKLSEKKGATETAYLEFAKKYGSCRLSNWSLSELSNSQRNALEKYENKYCSKNELFQTYYEVTQLRETRTAIIDEKEKNNPTILDIEEKRTEATEALDLKKDKEIMSAEKKYANSFNKVNTAFEWMKIKRITWNKKTWTEIQNDPFKGGTENNPIIQYGIIWKREYDSNLKEEVTITEEHGILELEYAFNQNWVNKYKTDKKYEKPFQGYLKIDYTAGGVAKTTYVDFTNSYEGNNKIPDEFHDEVHTTLLGKVQKFEIDLYSYLITLHPSLSSFNLKKVTLENKVTPPEPNADGIIKSSTDYDIEEEKDARKILLRTILIRGGDISIDELIECKGEFVLTTLRKLVEKTNLTMTIQPAKDRKDDMLVVEEKGTITQPVTYEEGVNIVGDIETSNYSPKGKIKNSIIKTYKSEIDDNKEIARYAVDMESIYHYGSLEDYEDTKYTSTNPGYIDYKAKEDLDSNTPNYAHSLRVRGCDEVKTDRLAEIISKRIHLSGFRQVKSIDREFSKENSPQWITKLGIEEKTLSTLVEATRAKYK